MTDGMVVARLAAVEAIGVALEAFGGDVSAAVAEAQSESAVIRRSADAALERRRSATRAAERASQAAAAALRGAPPEARPSLEAAAREAAAREARARDEQQRVERAIAVLTPALDRLRAALNVAQADIANQARDGLRSARGYGEGLRTYLDRSTS